MTDASSECKRFGQRIDGRVCHLHHLSTPNTPLSSVSQEYPVIASVAERTRCLIDADAWPRLRPTALPLRQHPGPGPVVMVGVHLGDLGLEPRLAGLRRADRAGVPP